MEGLLPTYPQVVFFPFFYKIMTSWLAGSLQTTAMHRSFSVKPVPHVHSCYLSVISCTWFQLTVILFFILLLQFVKIMLSSIPVLQSTCSHIQHTRKLFSYPGHWRNSSSIKGVQNRLRTDPFSPSLIMSYLGSKLHINFLWTEVFSEWIVDFCRWHFFRLLRRGS